jgi:hypothetical protein
VPRPDDLALGPLQRQLFALITAPAGVGPALDAMGIDRARLGELIVGDARASAVERLDVYANMYFYRIRDVLAEEFPKLAASLGAAPFHNLVTDYLVACPSRHPSLRYIGGALPPFLRVHALAAERPWLAELAALEWARLDVFDRADAAPLTREALAALAPEAFVELALPLIPAHEVVPTSHAVEDAWRAIEAGGDPRAPAPAEPAHALLVWRRGVVVHHRRLDDGEAAALAVLRGGGTFGTLCGELGATRSPDQAAARAAALLTRWLADELLAAC